MKKTFVITLIVFLLLSAGCSDREKDSADIIVQSPENTEKTTVQPTPSATPEPTAVLTLIPTTTPEPTPTPIGYVYMLRAFVIMSLRKD